MNEMNFIEQLRKNNVQINDKQVKQFHMYYEMLIDWNEKVNLTAITEKSEVYLKHFYDSITPSFFIDFTNDLSICDIGAGAGFPSIPLKICFPHLKITIVDSLNKRITFLQSLVNELQLSNVQLIHSRAEDFGQNKMYREGFDIVTARAVARMSVLSEFCLPVVKLHGHFIALKGSSAEEELNDAKKAIKTLGGKIEEKFEFNLPIENSERTIIKIIKERNTPKKYPRKAGTPVKNPL